jgi:hypothetical protein
MVAVLHHDYVCLFPREAGQAEQKSKAENNEPTFHSGGSQRTALTRKLADEPSTRALRRALEYAPDPEEEPAAAIITDGACEFDRPEYRVHDDPSRAIHGQVRWLRTEGQFVGLPHFI